MVFNSNILEAVFRYISEKERRRVTSLLLLFKVLMTALGASSYLYHL